MVEIFHETQTIFWTEFKQKIRNNTFLIESCDFANNYFGLLQMGIL